MKGIAYLLKACDLNHTGSSRSRSRIDTAMPLNSSINMDQASTDCKSGEVWVVESAMTVTQTQSYFIISWGEVC